MRSFLGSPPQPASEKVGDGDVVVGNRVLPPRGFRGPIYHGKPCTWRTTPTPAATPTHRVTLCPGHSDRLECMEAVLRDAEHLRAAQQSDPQLGTIITGPTYAKRELGGYVVDDQVYSRVHRAANLTLIVPPVSVPDVLTLTVGTFGYPGSHGPFSSLRREHRRSHAANVPGA